MNLVHWAVTYSIRGLLRMVCRVHDDHLARVPKQGPLILVCNHINSLDVPLMYTHLQPRSVTGFAKSETWDNPVMAMLFDLWGAIPIKRGEADVDALKHGLDVLAKGNIVVIAPEGTRSWDGKLQQAYAGVVFMGLRSGAPLLPLAYYGGEHLKENMRHLRRTDFYISVGRPFRLESGGVKVDRQVRTQMLDEVMYQLADLMPERYRGVYANQPTTALSYLRFCDSPQE
jgi:1-acyl-sn-glycerol-3-phosphate acyltransferase